MTHPHRRRWVKLYTQEAIAGTTRRELDPAERSLWWDFLALAGDSLTPGVIQVAPGIPYTDEQIATLLNVPLDLLARARAKMVKHGKVTLSGGCIIISKWEHYQGDYVRLQEYRHRVSDETPNPRVSNDAPRQEEEGRGSGGGKVISGSKVDLKGVLAVPGAKDTNLARACLAYENTFGTITPTARDHLLQLTLDYEIAWIESAFKEARDNQARRIQYVLATLERWGRDGYKALRPARYGPTAAQRRHQELPTGEELEKGWTGREKAQ